LKERKPVPALPDNLPVGKTLKEIEQHNNLVSDAFTANVMVHCPNCYRTFIEDRIEIHLKSCTPDHPHKPPPSINKNLDKKEEIKVYSPTTNPKSINTYQKTPEKEIIRPKTLMCYIW
jgi:zinc-finger of a C2HC-type